MVEPILDCAGRRLRSPPTAPAAPSAAEKHTRSVSGGSAASPEQGADGGGTPVPAGDGDGGCGVDGGHGDAQGKGLPKGMAWFLASPRKSSPSGACKDGDTQCRCFRSQSWRQFFLAPFPLTLFSTEPAHGILWDVPSQGDPAGHLGSDWGQQVSQGKENPDLSAALPQRLKWPPKGGSLALGVHGERSDPGTGDFESRRHRVCCCPGGRHSHPSCFCSQKVPKSDLCRAWLAQGGGGEATGGRILTLE